MAKKEIVWDRPDLRQELAMQAFPDSEGPEDRAMLFADGYDTAIIGYVEINHIPRVVYDIDRCLRVLVERDGMDIDGASEFFEYNTIRGNTYQPQDQAPLFIERAPWLDGMKFLDSPSEEAETPGLRAREQAVLDRLAEAWNAFTALSVQHPDDCEEFRHAIHQCQYLIAARVARRVVPDVYTSEVPT